MAPDPLSSRCTAHSKSNGGERCQHRVIGGGVCYVHGGNAPQVKAAREARVIAMRAQLAAGEREPQPPRSPHEVLLSAIDGSDRVMSQLRRDWERGELTPELSRAFGDWLDRSGRLAKLALDSNAAERWLAMQSQVPELQAARLIRAMDRFVNDPRVAVVGDPREVVRDALRELNDPAPGLRALPA